MARGTHRAGSVTSAKVYIHDLMCQHEELTLECYPFIGASWSESNATWSNTNQTSTGILGAKLSEHIISYVNNRVLAVGAYIANADGIDIEQRDYVEDENYKDEWELRAIGKPNTILYGVTAYGHNHDSVLLDVKNAMKDAGYGRVNIHTGEFTFSEYNECLKTADVFVSRSHGTAVTYQGTDTIAFSGILLNDKIPRLY